MRLRGVGTATRAVGPGPSEDAAIVLDAHGVAAVADGMGGAGLGDQASQVALAAVRERSTVFERLVGDTVGDRSSTARLALARALERLVTEAHQRVLDASKAHGKATMATTMALVVLASDHLQVAHVGAVRVYLFRRTGPQGKLRVLTEDHTLGALRHRSGNLTYEEYRASPLRKRLYTALGAGSDIDVDLRTVDVADGDRLLLCTQGVHALLDDDRIHALLPEGTPQQAADRLLAAAQRVGLEDDATAVVIDVGGRRDAATVEAVDQVLRENRLFRDLTPAERAIVGPYLDERTLPPAERLFVEGDPGDGFFVVARGTLRITHGGTPLTDVVPGMSFGELCLARDVPRSATVYAATEALVYGLTRARFAEVTTRRPGIAAKILLAALDGVGDRLREISDRLSTVERLATGVVEAGDVPLRTAIVRAARGDWTAPPIVPTHPRGPTTDLPSVDDMTDITE